MNKQEFHRWSFLQSMLVIDNGTVPYSRIFTKTGLAKSTVNDVLKGLHEPSQDTLRKIAAYLNTVASALVIKSEEHFKTI